MGIGGCKTARNLYTYLKYTIRSAAIMKVLKPALDFISALYELFGYCHPLLLAESNPEKTFEAPLMYVNYGLTMTLMSDPEMLLMYE